MRAKGGEAATVEGIVADHRAAPVDARLAAALDFLEKVTLRPAELGPADAAALRAAGVSDAAAEEALRVAFLFNVMARLAEAFDFAIPTAAGRRFAVRAMLDAGYEGESIPE